MPSIMRKRGSGGSHHNNYNNKPLALSSRGDNIGGMGMDSIDIRKSHLKSSSSAPIHVSNHGQGHGASKRHIRQTAFESEPAPLQSQSQSQSRMQMQRDASMMSRSSIDTNVLLGDLNSHRRNHERFISSLPSIPVSSGSSSSTVKSASKKQSQTQTNPNSFEDAFDVNQNPFSTVIMDNNGGSSSNSNSNGNANDPSVVSPSAPLSAQFQRTFGRQTNKNTHINSRNNNHQGQGQVQNLKVQTTHLFDEIPTSGQGQRRGRGKVDDYNNPSPTDFFEFDQAFMNTNTDSDWDNMDMDMKSNAHNGNSIYNNIKKASQQTTARSGNSNSNSSSNSKKNTTMAMTMPMTTHTNSHSNANASRVSVPVVTPSHMQHFPKSSSSASGSASASLSSSSLLSHKKYPQGRGRGQGQVVKGKGQEVTNHFGHFNGMALDLDMDDSTVGTFSTQWSRRTLLRNKLEQEDYNGGDRDGNDKNNNRPRSSPYDDDQNHHDEDEEYEYAPGHEYGQQLGLKEQETKTPQRRKAHRKTETFSPISMFISSPTRRKQKYKKKSGGSGNSGSGSGKSSKSSKSKSKSSSKSGSTRSSGSATGSTSSGSSSRRSDKYESMNNNRISNGIGGGIGIGSGRRRLLKGMNKLVEDDDYDHNDIPATDTRTIYNDGFEQNQRDRDKQEQLQLQQHHHQQQQQHRDVLNNSYETHRSARTGSANVPSSGSGANALNNSYETHRSVGSGHGKHNHNTSIIIEKEVILDTIDAPRSRSSAPRSPHRGRIAGSGTGTLGIAAMTSPERRYRISSESMERHDAGNYYSLRMNGNKNDDVSVSSNASVGSIGKRAMESARKHQSQRRNNNEYRAHTHKKPAGPASEMLLRAAYNDSAIASLDSGEHKNHNHNNTNNKVQPQDPGKMTDRVNRSNNNTGLDNTRSSTSRSTQKPVAAGMLPPSSRDRSERERERSLSATNSKPPLLSKKKNIPVFENDDCDGVDDDEALSSLPIPNPLKASTPTPTQASAPVSAKPRRKEIDRFTSHDEMSPLPSSYRVQKIMEKGGRVGAATKEESDNLEANSNSNSNSNSNLVTPIKSRVLFGGEGELLDNSWQPSPIAHGGSFAIFDVTQDYTQIAAAAMGPSDVNVTTPSSSPNVSADAIAISLENSSEEAEFMKVVAAIVIQTFMRRHLAYKLTCQRYRAVLVIQHFVHSRIQRRRAVEDAHLKLYDMAAINIQAIWRGWWVRDCLNVENYCASLIQRNFRSYWAKLNFKYDQYRVIIVQAQARSFLVKRKIQKMNSAATSIQCQLRVFLARYRTYQTLANILVVQSVCRRFLAKKRVDILMKKRSAAFRKRANIGIGIKPRDNKGYHGHGYPERTIMNSDKVSHSTRTVQAGTHSLRSHKTGEVEVIHHRNNESDRDGAFLSPQSAHDIDGDDLIRKWQSRRSRRSSRKKSPRRDVAEF